MRNRLTVHEMALASALMETALRSMAEHQASRIVTITVLIGVMTQVESESLTSCFDALKAGTPAAGATLIMKRVPLTGQCRNCRNEFPIAEYRLLCPDCSATAVEILSGRELRIERMEVE